MANNVTDDVPIDVEAWIYSPKTLVSGNFVMSPNFCIYKTPTKLFRHNEEAYVPHGFSIGPWHLGKPKLKATQNIKMKYLQGLVCRSRDPQRNLRQLEEEIRRVEKEARECYVGSVEFSVEHFVKILLLDGCFIIELLRKDAKLVGIEKDDPVFSMSYLNQLLYHDLILLENQIPWLVLDRLFNMTETPESKPLDQLVIEFFGNIFSSDRPPMQLLQDTNFPRHNSKHILDLLRNSLVLSIEEHEHRLGWQPFPSATSLKEAGINFRKVVSNSILEIKFTDGILEIPSLQIQETTETLFRNLISFEQCYPNCSPRVTSYVKLLDNLINTTQDVTILSEMGIVDNRLNPEVTAKFFARLYEDAHVDDFYYLELCERVNAYFYGEYKRRKWLKWRANLMNNYCNSPWAIVGVLAGTAILVLTFLQTVFTIKN